jgi:hypothetical protein
MRYTRALTAAALLAAVPALAQGPSTPSPPGQTAARDRPDAATEVTATGCLQLAADGKTFVLANVQSAPGTVDSPVSGPAAGTSATGDAPSGSVTGRTPTGSTAVETAAPLPDAGTPGQAASPASPTYQQPSATATTGTVARPDSERREYRLLPAPGVNLQAHVGHTVEVAGTVQPASADATRTPPPARAPGPDAKKGSETRGATAQPAIAQAVIVERVRHILPSCAP